MFLKRPVQSIEVLNMKITTKMEVIWNNKKHNQSI
jgi:hypothetical protein